MKTKSFWIFLQAQLNETDTVKFYKRLGWEKDSWYHHNKRNVIPRAHTLKTAIKSLRLSEKVMNEYLALWLKS